MAVLYSYPIKSTPANRNDLVIISDSRDNNKTKQIAVANLPGSASFSGIGGSGEVNYIPKFSTSTDLVNSIIYEQSSNIGIGTTSPSFKLDVVGNARASYFALRSNESLPAESAFIYRPATGVIGFGTASTERMRITSGGLVGIGTVTPGEKLEVAGKIKVTGTADFITTTRNSAGQANYIKFYNTATSANEAYIGFTSNNKDLKFQNLDTTGTISLRTGSAVALRVTEAGNVGIGTTSPGEKLQVAGNIKTTAGFISTVSSGYATLELGGSTGAYIDLKSPSTDDYDLRILSTGSGGSFWTGGFGHVMTLSSTGNVGIGVTSPAARLDIVSNGQTSIRVTNDQYNNYLIQKRRSDNSQVFGITETSSNGSMSLVTAGTQRLTVTNQGRVGIGTVNPLSIFQISDGNPDVYITSADTGQSDIFFGGSTTPTKGNIKYSDNADAMIFKVNTNTEALRIVSAGDVGIGTTAPSDGDLTIGTPKLHVATGGTSGTFNLAARFQSTTSDADNTGTSILINSLNDRGLLIKAGRKDGDREVAYFDVVTSIGNTTNMLTMGKFDSTYKVGIGTTNPTADGLEIASMVGVSGGNTQLFITGSTNGRSVLGLGDGSNRFVQHILTDHTQNMMSFHTGASAVTNNERMRITSTGNVGIGTTSPSNKLTVGTLGSETSIACASTGFDSLRLGTLTFPSAAGWYRVASYSVAGARGGARIDLCITGGAFAPVTYSIDYFKSYTQTGTDHTLKLEQYGDPVFITKARIAFDGTTTYIEVYKVATTSQGTMPAQVHFNRLIGESGGSLPMFGTATSGTGSTSLKEVEFIVKGTSVEALQVQGGNLNLKNLPTSTSGLAAGDIYNDGGTLKIVS